MNILNLVVRDRDGREAALNFPVRRLLMAGFTGRDQKVAMKHVKELREHGVEAPEKIPAFYAVPNHLVAVAGEIEVLGNQTSGEVEPVFLFKKARSISASAAIIPTAILSGRASPSRK